MRKFQFDGKKCKLLATVMTAALLGACSSDVSRFDEDPFKNPFRSRAAFDPVNTNSISRPKTSASTQRALEPVSNGVATTQALPAPSQPMMGASALTTGSVGTANYPALAPIAARQPSVLGNSTGWSAVGGTPVTLQQGENLNGLSSRYGVPVSAIMAVNGLSSVNQAQPGQQIMIPAYNAVQGSKAGQGIKAAATPAAGSVIQRAQPVAQQLPAATTQSIPAIPPRAAAVVPATQPVKVAAAARQITPPTETDAERRAAAKLKEMKSPKPAQKPADDEDEDDKPAAAPKKKADALSKEAQSKADAAKKAEAVQKAAEAKAKIEADKAKAAKIIAARKAKSEDDTVTTASIPEVKSPAKTQPMPAKAEPVARTEPEKETTTASTETEGASFRWPAKGRVISGFGARGTGGANDGINIAVPEGTPVRAAEGGTVVHADDALKGYGKLVLIRHTNGYVSVYAHNGELNVKRGESVKRGQVIAKSGQSGNVTAPQLHFEIRKGATPVDPTKHLGE
jgi:murein DD-endopeptidase MepM/ murein hydrolase activator NlpD